MRRVRRGLFECVRWLVVALVALGDTTILSGCIQSAGPVTARFTATPRAGVAPLNVSFVGTATVRAPYTLAEGTAKFRDMTPSSNVLTITEWRWDFGDGSGASGRLADHVYRTPGIYEVSLLVRLDDGSSARATGQVEVRADNVAPVADAGPDQVVAPGAAVQLDGTASSDADGNSLTYLWQLAASPEGGDAVLENATAAVCSFSANVAGTYTVSLVVNDGTADSAPDTVDVLVNRPPVSDAGPDMTVLVGDTAQLDGSGSSDADGDAITHAWSLVSQPSESEATLAGPDTAAPTLTPDEPGAYEVQLTVHDGHVAGAPDTVVVTATEPVNLAPVADAGPDQTIQLAAGETEATVVLDGSGSHDPDGSIAAYHWEGTPTPEAIATPSVVLGEGLHAFFLRVTDDLGRQSAVSSVSVLVSAGEDTPRVAIADAGADIVRTLATGQETLTVSLDGGASHVLGGSISAYEWTGEPDPDDVVAPTLTLPEGAYVFSLRIKDDLGFYSPPDQVTVTVRRAENSAPVFTTTPYESALQRTYYFYEAEAVDPDGDTLAYKLSVRPSGMLVDSATGMVSWPVGETAAGQHEVTLTATDPYGASASQTWNVAVTETNEAPWFLSVPNRFAKVGETYAYAARAIDPDEDPLTYALLEGPAGIALDADSGQLSWTPAEADAGVRSIALRAADPSDASDVQQYVLHVYDPAVPLELSSPEGPYTVRVGDTLSVPVTMNYPMATVRGISLPEGAEVTRETFTFTPVAAQEGVHYVGFVAKYGDMRDSTTAVITVEREQNAPPVFAAVPAQTVREGEQLRFDVIASDPDGDAVAITAPNLTLANAVHDRLEGAFIFAPDFTQAGAYSVSFEASDGQATAALEVSITVEDVTAGVEDLNLALDPPSTPTFETAQTIAGTVNGPAGAGPAARPLVFITGLAPDSAVQGETLSVDITGYNTAFAAGGVVFEFGAGVTVGEVTVDSPTAARATITVSDSASTGTRTVRARYGAGEAYATVGFRVEDGGGAVVTGQVVDPFTGQALANARVFVQGLPYATTTDEEGRFTLSGLPAGAYEIMFMRSDYSTFSVSLALEPGQTFTIEAPIELDALARPFSPGGTLPAEATLASIIDRGIGMEDIDGDVTVEQLEVLLSDALLAVGGDVFGVIDEHGEQLNPNIEGSGVISLTQEGLTSHAKAMVEGRSQTLGQIFSTLYGFDSTYELAEFLGGVQRAVDVAWEDPNDPNSTVPIMLFNKGTTLSVDPPRINAETSLNHMQAYFFTTTWMMYNYVPLSIGVDDALEQMGIDPDSVHYGSSGDLEYEPVSGASVGSASAGASPGRQALKDVPDQIDHEKRAGEFRLGKHGSAWFEYLGYEMVVAAVQSTLVAAAVTFFIGSIVTFALGSSTGTLAGTLTGGSIAGLLEGAAVAALMGKFALDGLVANMRDTLRPYPPVPDRHIEQDGKHLIYFVPSTSSGQGVAIWNLHGMGTGSPYVSASSMYGYQDSGAAWYDQDVGFAWEYRLYKFPSAVSLADGALVQGATFSVPKPETNPYPGRELCEVPEWALTPGENNFRIVTIQYLRDGWFYNTTPDAADPLAGFQYTPMVLTDDTYAGQIGIYTPLWDYDEWSDARELEFADARYVALRDLQSETNLGPYNDTKLALDANYRKYSQLVGEHQAVTDALNNAVLPEHVVRNAKLRDLVVGYANEELGSGQIDDPEFWRQAEEIYDGELPDELKSSMEGLYDRQLEANLEKINLNQNQQDATAFKTMAEKWNTSNPENVTDLRQALADFEEGGTHAGTITIADFNEGDNSFTFKVTILDENGVPRVETGYANVADGFPTRLSDLADVVDDNVRTTSRNYALLNNLAIRDGSDVVGEAIPDAVIETFKKDNDVYIKKKNNVIGDIVDDKMKLIDYEDAAVSAAELRLQSKLKYINGAVKVVDAFGNVLAVAEVGEKFGQGLQILSSDMSAVFSIVLTDREDDFPAWVTPHPNVAPGNFNTYIYGSLGTVAEDPDGKGGMLRHRGPPSSVVRVDDTVRGDYQAGFPPEFLVSDGEQWIYAHNDNSNDLYGGRIFRYNTLENYRREYVGSLTHFRYDIMQAAPVLPVAGAMSLELNRLYYAVVDLRDNSRDILALAIRPDLGPLTADVMWDDEDFEFTGPTDMEVWYVDDPVLGPTTNITITDNSKIWEVQQIHNVSDRLPPKLMLYDGDRKWSGLAYDYLGNLYLADYNLSEIFRIPAEQLAAWREYREPVTPEPVLVNTALKNLGDIELSHDQTMIHAAVKVAMRDKVVTLNIPGALRLDSDAVIGVYIRDFDRKVYLPNQAPDSGFFECAVPPLGGVGIGKYQKIVNIEYLNPSTGAESTKQALISLPAPGYTGSVAVPPDFFE